MELVPPPEILIQVFRATQPRAGGVGHDELEERVVRGVISAIRSIRLLRNSVTHENNMDQRICKLSFTTGADVLNVTAPSTGNICPPGHYLLFILNGSGVPSVHDSDEHGTPVGGTPVSDHIRPCSARLRPAPQDPPQRL